MQILAIAFVVSVMFVPPSLFLRPDFLLAGVAVAASAASSQKRMAFGLVRLEALAIVVLWLLAVMTLIGQALTTRNFIAQDAMILLRYGFYLCALLFGAVTGSMTRQPLKAFRVTILAGVAVVVTVSIAQYFYPGGMLGAVTLDIYGRPDYLGMIRVATRRITGTMENPNYWGFYASALLLVSVVYLAFAKRRLWGIAAGLLLWVVILTGSRTAVLAPLIAWIGLIVLMVAVGHERISRSVVVTCTLLVLVAAVLYLVMAQGGYEYAGRFAIENTRTLDYRLQHWGRIWNEIEGDLARLLIGSGPRKAEGPLWVDNMYLRLLSNYGVMAAGAYMALVWTGIRRLVSLLHGASHQVRLHLAIAVLVWLLMATFDLVADTWFNVRIASLVLFLHGFMVAVGIRDRTARGPLRETKDFARTYAKNARW